MRLSKTLYHGEDTKNRRTLLPGEVKDPTRFIYNVTCKCTKPLFNNGAIGPGRVVHTTDCGRRCCMTQTWARTLCVITPSVGCLTTSRHKAVCRTEQNGYRHLTINGEVTLYRRSLDGATSTVRVPLRRYIVRRSSDGARWSHSSWGTRLPFILVLCLGWNVRLIA